MAIMTLHIFIIIYILNRVSILFNNDNSLVLKINPNVNFLVNK